MGRPKPIRTSSLDELRARFLEQGEPASPHLIAALRRDPRQGAQTLAEQLSNSRRRALAEERRMLSLLAWEEEHWTRGVVRIAGVDEVGMGPLAGPVVAAAAILHPHDRIDGVNDSKQLDAEERTRLAEIIRSRAVAIGIGEASVEEIGRINILQAGLLAMRRALLALSPEPELVLVDARKIDGLPWPQEARIKADASVHCVACASVVAKVHRDAMMTALDETYPGYGFAQHKGYGTPAHLEALERLGPSPIHRSTFHWGGRQLTLFGS
ncbi:MAG: ribonuclease HII [Candidatus Eisenbacteria bacterium]|uniref:Ribonuclease HII n=1 Tax=Eiseniibacteriota bacterium TaxID=2212470 RepID=A0A956M207_UNCEI|nr:ribonuclease HII [Candidatus Eisenbacteria bacterium]